MNQSASEGKRAIAAFVSMLAAVPSRTDLFNPYAASHPGGAARAARLACYLEQMRLRRPRLLLVGEAIGYRGGAVSGIPFTSLDVLARTPLLAGCRMSDMADAAGAYREATATIIWSAFADVPEDALPLLWNSVPFHPHQAQRRNTNRPPRVGERRAGQAMLTLLLGLIPVSHIAAVGRHAARSMTTMGLPHTPLRHPSHGGKARFLAGLAPLLARRGDEAR